MPKKILLADDSITIQKVVELTFSDGDYEVTAVNNGAKAVQKLAEMRPDIILSDIIMPEKNGYEVCEYVKSHPEYRNIPVILLTGTFEPFDPDRAEKAGCEAVVTKPFESQSLIHKVEELIAQAQTTQVAPIPTAPEPQPAPSPWEEEEPQSAPSPFSSASGTFPAAPDPFTHDNDIFSAPPPPQATTEMPFDAPSAEPFGAPPAAEEFSGETRAFTKMSFEEMQQFAPQTAPPPPPAPEPEPSPWDEPAGNEFGGETRAFPKMTFDEMMAAESAAAAPPPAPEPEPIEVQPDMESESPFGAPPPAEEFSGETRAFPKMSFEEMQQFAAPPPPPPEPEVVPPPPPEPSPWDEAPSAEASPWDQPAEELPSGGETRAFPKMSFEDLPSMQAPEAAEEPPTAVWSEPPAWSPASEVPEEAPAPQSFEAMPEDLPFATETTAPPPPEETYAEEVPPPESEPVWAPEAAAEAEAEQVEPPVPSPALAPQSEPAIPIAARDLTDEQVDRIARRVVELMSDHVVRNIAWEVIPDLAEMVVKERIRQLESEA